MSDLIDGSVPLRRGSTLCEQVTELLRAEVMTGAREVGAMLPSESRLAQTLDVSRTVVREAVSRLKAEGLLASRQGRGVFVASDRPQMGFAIDRQDVESLRKLRQILELRIGVEVEAAALAAERASDEARHEVMAAARAFGEVSREGALVVEDGVAQDIRFHRAVAGATGNAYYLGLFDYLGASLRETILAGRLKAVARGGDNSAAVQEHLAVAEAIGAGDSEAAAGHMRAHLKRSAARLLGHLEGEGW